MTKQKSANTFKLQRLTTVAVLAALSLVLMATLRFPIFPSAPFYEMEFSDVPVLVITALFGPLYGLVSLFIVCIIQTLTVSSASGIIGFLMHFLSSGLMIILLTSIRKRLHGFNGIVFSGVAGVVGVVLVMIPMNLWLASSFMGLEPTAFIRDFLGVCVGFNVIKATANIVIYSVLSPAIIKEYNKLTHSD